MDSYSASESSVLESINPELKDAQSMLPINPDQYTKSGTPHMTSFNSWSDWNYDQEITSLWCCQDFRCLRLVLTHNRKSQDPPPDVLVKESGLPVPKAIVKEWTWWWNQLPLHSNHHIPRCCFTKDSIITIAWLFRCIRESLLRSCTSPDGRLEWHYTHIIGNVQDQGYTDQETDHSLSHFSTIAVSLQGSPQRTNAVYIRLDWLYHSP